MSTFKTVSSDYRKALEIYRTPIKTEKVFSSEKMIDFLLLSSALSSLDVDVLGYIHIIIILFHSSQCHFLANNYLIYNSVILYTTGPWYINK